MEIAQSALDNYEEPSPTSQTIIHDFLRDILQDNINSKQINIYMNEINDMVIAFDEDGILTTDFEEIVVKTQELAISVKNFDSLLELNEIASQDSDIMSQDTNIAIQQLKKDYLSNEILTPVPSSVDFEAQKEKWETSWNERLSALGTIAKSIPLYNNNSSGGIKDIEHIANMQILENYDGQKISNEIDLITRGYLANINALERAFMLLTGNFPFLAWFSAIFAVFLDLSSLLVGLFIYSVSLDKDNKTNLIELKNNSKNKSEK